MGLGDTLKRVATGISTGGLSEVARYMKGGLYDKVTQDQVPLETPEQRAARIKLMEFANTGQFGDFKAGEQVPLGYGDYDVTGIEDRGLSSLQALLQSGDPAMFDAGDSAIRDLLNTSQEGLEAQFNPFNTILDRSIRDSGDAFKRSAGFQGNLYSTATNRNLSDLQARGNESRAGELARLTNSALDRKLSATGMAYEAGKARENTALNRVQASQVYGGLTRRLNDEKIKARDAELIRRRQELGMPIQAAQTVAGQNANFGVPSVTTNQPTELMELLKLLVGGGAMFAGAR